MCRFRGERALGGGNSKCKGPEAGTGKNLVLRNRKTDSLAGQLDREGQEEMVVVRQHAEVRLLFSGQGNH